MCSKQALHGGSILGYTWRMPIKTCTTARVPVKFPHLRPKCRQTPAKISNFSRKKWPRVQKLWRHEISFRLCMTWQTRPKLELASTTPRLQTIETEICKNHDGIRDKERNCQFSLQHEHKFVSWLVNSNFYLVQTWLLKYWVAHCCFKSLDIFRIIPWKSTEIERY